MNYDVSRGTRTSRQIWEGGEATSEDMRQWQTRGSLAGTATQWWEQETCVEATSTSLSLPHMTHDGQREKRRVQRPAHCAHVVGTSWQVLILAFCAWSRTLCAQRWVVLVELKLLPQCYSQAKPRVVIRALRALSCEGGQQACGATRAIAGAASGQGCHAGLCVSGHLVTLNVLATVGAQNPGLTTAAS